MNEVTSIDGTIYVVDDDHDLRKSIEWTLSSVGYRVQAFPTAQDCLDVFDPTVPGCLVVDLLLPGMTGIHLCRKLAASQAKCAFVMISGHGDVTSAVEVMKLGAIDFLEKPFSREKLLQAVHEGLAESCRRDIELSSEKEILERIEELTAREREVFDCLMEGLVTKQIASRLEISARTVDVHRASIMKKLELESPTQFGYLMYVYNRHSRREDPR